MATKHNFNNQLQNWFSNNRVQTNKPITGISRESFILLYHYRWVQLHPRAKSHSPRFNTKIARTLAFFVMSVPDDSLSRMIQSFSAYRGYLVKASNHLIKRSTYRIRASDLNDYDKNILNLIFAFYRYDDYKKMGTIVKDGYSFLFNKNLLDSIKTHDINRWVLAANENNLISPIEISLKDSNFLLHDAKHTIAVPDI